MYKFLIFLKRKPGLSLDEFRDYYENNHRKLGEKHMPGVSRYVRRYITPLSGGAPEYAVALDFDVITEMWFDDRAAFEAAMAHVAQPDVIAEIFEDEERLFDRTRMSFSSVEEVDSDFGRVWE